MVFDKITTFCVKKLQMTESVFCVNVEKHFVGKKLKFVRRCVLSGDMAVICSEDWHLAPASGGRQKEIFWSVAGR